MLFPPIERWSSLERAIQNEDSLEEITRLLDSGALTIARNESQQRDALFMAATKGRDDIVLLLLGRGADINAVSGIHGTALTAAAIQGQTATVSLLLERGANINEVGRKYGTALAAAALEGQTATVSLLLDRGADVNVVGGEYGTVLASAAIVGKPATVSLLLDRGADINAVGGKHGTALAAAAIRGHRTIVSLLLDRGADTNVVGGEHGSALGAAAFGENKVIMELLVDKGADINAVCGSYGIVLAAAATRGHTATLSLLLDLGADINAVSGKDGPALAAAAIVGKTDTVSLLLDRGADINAVGGEYGTALGAAVFGQKRDIVKLLVKRGADINAVCGNYGTALAVAATRRQLATLSLLLDLGADINAVGGEYGTALAAAAFGGYSATVARLLDRGADINAVGGKYGTALAAAAIVGHTTIVSLLLDRGADINAVGGKYGTALAAAASVGESHTLLMLLTRGADINAVGGEYGTALGAAAFSQKVDIMIMLEHSGADVNLVIDELGTVLGRATYQWSTEIASLLLQSGADVMRVGGSYPTASGVYPSALDVALSEGSRADPTLLALLTTAMNEQIQQNDNSNVDLVHDVISRPPFPMPYTRPYSVVCPSHRKGALPSSLISSFDTLSTQLPPGGNITPEQADVPCQELSEEVLCRSLTALFGLQDTTQAKHQWIRNDVRYFVACGFDFGLAYAAARVAWKHFNEHSVDSSVISVQRSQWHKHIQMLDEERSKVMEIDHSNSAQELITSPYSIMPRRLWDLRSNRVVDFKMLHASQSIIDTPPSFWAVSHSWTGDMFPVWTAMNQHQWPVPLPQSISLDYLRSELLTLGAEYVWIDVVCLRQQSDIDYFEQLRQDEWKLDVPTIGNIYRAAANIVRYFNGLGVCFSNKGWDDPRHWLQRAWTLQEIANENTTINGGIPQDLDQVFLNSQGKVSEKVVKLRSALRPVIQLAAQVDSSHGCEVYELAREMKRRHASQPLDKLSGLLYLLRTTKLPCYDETMTSEDIWRQCFHLLPAGRKAEILFDFPYRGSDEQWFPTWAQVLDWPVRDPEYDHLRSRGPPGMGDISGEMSFLIRAIWAIPDVGLYETGTPGEYKVNINNRSGFYFYLPYLLQEPISIQDQPVFILATADLGHAHNWVVCRAIDKRLGTAFGLDGVAEVNVLKKVGVIRTDSCGELLVGGLLQKMDCVFV